MKTLTIESLKNYFTASAYENDFFVQAHIILDRALNIDFESKAELSDWVNEQLDSDDFDIDADTFTDDVNDIINAVANLYSLN